eukprot:Skav210029  [mRNA]  locus=scaffold706:53310:55582:+ [translate_table: standard]
MEATGAEGSGADALQKWLIARLESYGINLGDLEPGFRQMLLEDLPNLPALPPLQDGPTQRPREATGASCRSWNFVKGQVRKMRSDVVDLWRSLPLQAEKRAVKVLVQLVIFLLSIWYAVDVTQNKYPKAIETFSGYVFVARFAGFACALETGLLYGSMARYWLSMLSRWVRPRHWVFVLVKASLEAHQDAHVEAGVATILYGSLHAGCHLLGTVPALQEKSAEELNDVIGCAQENPPFWLHLTRKLLQWPSCPLDEETKPQTFLEVIFMTMPAVTGLLLGSLLLLLGITSCFRHEKGREKIRCNFDYKWFKRAHLLAIWLWPVLLFLHGSQQWLGIGTPLAFFDLVVVAPFAYGRMRQTQNCETTIRRVIVWRSSWVHIDLILPEGCHFVPGMYAKLAFPAISSELHSFSITTGAEEGVIGFTFQFVVKKDFPQAFDWSRKVIQRLALDVADPERPLPSVLVQGGFTAATQWALQCLVVLLIGQNRGMTPCISASCALAAGNDQLEEAVCLLESYDKDHFLMHPELFQVQNDKVSMHFFVSSKGDAEDVRFRTWLKRSGNPGNAGNAGNAVLQTRLSPSQQLTARPPLPTNEAYVVLQLGSPDYVQHIGALAQKHPDLGLDVFVCGKPALYHKVTQACQRCRAERPGQRIRLHLE